MTTFEAQNNVRAAQAASNAACHSFLTPPSLKPLVDAALIAAYL